VPKLLARDGNVHIFSDNSNADKMITPLRQRRGAGGEVCPDDKTPGTRRSLANMRLSVCCALLRSG
jgi:hypothetical protein